MKYIIIIMVSCFSLYSCTKTHQKRELTLEQQQERIRLDSLYLLYDSMPPRFDIKDFNEKRGDKDSYGFYIGDSIYIEYSFLENNYRIKKEILETPLIEYIYYNSLGIIEKKYSVLYDSILYGNYFRYDENGKLIDIVHKSPYFICTDFNLMDFINLIEIQRYKMSYNLNYDNIENRSYWYLCEQISYRKYREFYLDAETGELLDYIEYDYGDINEEYYSWKLSKEGFDK